MLEEAGPSRNCANTSARPMSMDCGRPRIGCPDCRHRLTRLDLGKETTLPTWLRPCSPYTPSDHASPPGEAGYIHIRGKPSQKSKKSHGGRR